jgi:chaperone BCS1
VWVEFRNASKWQSELLFRNFFPSAEAEEMIMTAEEALAFEQGLKDLSSPETPSTPASSLPSDTLFSPPPVEISYRAPLTAARLSELSKIFAESIPDDEFSVAALQGWLLKNKTKPESAALEAADWVKSEREMKERLAREKEERERKERLDVSYILTRYMLLANRSPLQRERRRRELIEKEAKDKLEKEAKEAEVRKELEAEERKKMEEKIRKEMEEKVQAAAKAKEDEAKEAAKAKDSESSTTSPSSAATKGTTSDGSTTPAESVSEGWVPTEKPNEDDKENKEAETKKAD